MRIPIDTRSSTPIFRQIAGWLRENIQNGNLPVETRLPATRALADELGVSRITIKNAYALVESDGLILTRQGSGTFVAPPIESLNNVKNEGDKKWPLWQLEQGRVPSPPASMNTLPVPSKDIISFTGVGDPSQYPASEFVKILQDVVRRDGTAALEYGKFGAGYSPLQTTISRILANQGIQTSPNQVLVTSGSQQALAMVCHQLLREGDVILVEKPTYNLALDLFRHLKLKIISIAVDENGMQVENIEPFLQQNHPRLIYTIPNFQNPSGVCMSVPRRRLLLALANRYNIPILEDDFVGDLRFSGRGLPAIKAMDSIGQVIYIGTFSKMLMPGIRVGYLVVDGPIFDQLVHQKMVIDLTTSHLIQRALDLYVTVGRYQTHLRRSSKLYRQRRDVLVRAIQHYLPEASFSIPQGGLFLWMKLPGVGSTQAMLPSAIQAGVEYAPGSRFFADAEEGNSFLRLNFATVDFEKIELGIKTLARVYRQIEN